MNEFDLAGPLPRHTTLLEASAGTGKTHAIAELTARFLAETDLDVSDLLLITFGNHAAGELRARVFERLTEIVSAGESASTERLREALTRFNEATILTTHAFCDAMLAELGILGDWDVTESVGPDPQELMEQCATDTYLRLYRNDPEPPLTAKEALAIGREACRTTLPLLPDDGPHRSFAEDVRELYTKRKAVIGLRTFNDVTTRLRTLLADPVTGPAVRDRLRQRFPVVLVDEFQDTDPDQWAIIEMAFVAPDRPTILIGDPKQSIYGFRGADLGSYLSARATAEVATLATNHRSDRSVVEGVEALFGDTTMGSPEVRVTPVTAHHDDRLVLPIASRIWIREATEAELSRDPQTAVDNDLVRQVRHLLTRTTVKPQEIAVLVRTGARAQRIAAALRHAGHPAVLTGSQTVWTRPIARAWGTLLTAMADPSQAHIRLAALSPLIGAGLDDLLAEGSPVAAEVSTLVRGLAQAFRAGGVAAVLEALRTSTDLDRRLLLERDGERDLTDACHVAELLDASGERTLSGLIALVERRHDDEDGASLRISTDEPAIRVMTLHAAKGLQFPVVLLPETGGTVARRSKPFTLVKSDRRHLYVGPAPFWRDEIAQDLNRQTLDEELRLLYVGFTRAKHLAIAWHVAPARSGGHGPLGTLLAKNPGGAVFRCPLDESPVEPVVPGPRPEMTLSPPPQPPRVDQTWRRTSYSGLTAGLHESPVHVVADEPTDVDLAPAEPTSEELRAPSPMANLPAGAGFGTLVHELLERLDWAPATLEASAADLVRELGPQHHLTPEQQENLTAAIIDVCRTPLQPLGRFTLSDLPTSSRLAELDFDLPLADAGRPPSLGQLADLMSAHLAPDDPLADYPSRLRSSDAAEAVLNGFLTGSIDVVLRLPDDSFAVVDYKTNRLSANAADPLVLGHYTPSPMAEAMMQAHYPLQAILYSAALHRYLGARLATYDPHRHLGWVGYLFVRGMAGPQTPLVDGSSCGVFGWRPPPALAVSVSELLGGLR
ncbi:UvrD-helicase domain-containing protein [Tessaracoccus flavus]|uniref:RecBCD enzyme subunit RecB n=1 Tax=Tessaracoccus flavus TaxID=1610493 RepID=A0A1Q2CEP7_9ACTN|nr:UvrD-helicase domain-containing protein [Tessaracoccus flavus]AQP44578.1 hypothetical protein RPIT_06925 [Tessaracoccus flavus]SDZ09308.1 exodeoxyribonuclease V beta subunit [Tessaracoccus flavus]